MIKSSIIANLAANMTHLPEKQVSDGVNHLLTLMSQSLADGLRIEIRDFGSFSPKHRSPRNAHNPKTGEHVITIPKYTAYFKPGKALRERIELNRLTHPIQAYD